MRCSTVVSCPTMQHDRDQHEHDHEQHEQHQHDHARARATTSMSTTTPEPGGLVGRLRHLVAPHSHDAAVAMDSELETSRRGMRALLLSFVALIVTAALQALVFLVSGSVALLVDTHPQRRRRAHRGADRGRVHPRPPGRQPVATPTATAGPRTSRASWWWWSSRRPPCSPPTRRSAGCPTRSDARPPRAAGPGRGDRLPGQRAGRAVPDHRRAPDRLGRAGGRRAARPYRRLHLARGRAQRAGGLGRLRRADAIVGPAHHGGGARGAARRRARRLPAADGRRRPGAGRPGRARRPAHRRRAGRRRRAAALDRPPAPGRAGDRRRRRAHRRRRPTSIAEAPSTGCCTTCPGCTPLWCTPTRPVTRTTSPGTTESRETERHRAPRPGSWRAQDRGVTVRPSR